MKLNTKLHRDWDWGFRGTGPEQGFGFFVHQKISKLQCSVLKNIARALFASSASVLLAKIESV